MTADIQQLHSIAGLVGDVKKAGRRAINEQKKLQLSDRTLKADQSVVTAVDNKVEDYLVEKISAAYPLANIVGEESVRSFDADRLYTFAVDPIDGTDSFSQGMPGWAISVGVLDQKLQPVAGIVYAPAWDMLFFADLGQKALYNNEPIKPVTKPEPLGPRTNLLADSRIHHFFALDDYPGKLRSLGSTAIHLCGVLTYGGVLGAVSRPVRVWDLAGAHAIVASMGYAVEYFNGQTIDYQALIAGEPAPDIILAGTSSAVDLLRQTFRKR